MNKKSVVFFLLVCVALLFLSSCASTKHEHNSFYFKTTKEATCMEKGTREVYCGSCRKLVRSEEIPATGNHLYGSSRSLKAPTCTEPGLVSHTCSLCGYTFEDPSAPNGHSYSDVEVVFGSWGEENKCFKVCVVCGDKVQISESEAQERLKKLGKSL